MLITRVNLNRFTKIRVTGDRKMHFENHKMIYWIKICKMEENLISDGKFSVYFFKIQFKIKFKIQFLRRKNGFLCYQNDTG